MIFSLKKVKKIRKWLTWLIESVEVIEADLLNLMNAGEQQTTPDAQIFLNRLTMFKMNLNF